MIKKSLDEFKKDKEDEFKNKLSFLAVKNIFWERPDSIEKETEITRKYTKEIDVFKAKIIGIKELIIGTIHYDCNSLLSDLDFKAKLLVKVVKLIEIKLKRQNVSESLIDVTERLLFNRVSSECYGIYDPYLD